jgi:hypothetical protein
MRSIPVSLVVLLAALFSRPLSSLTTQFLGRGVEHIATIAKSINVDLFIIQILLNCNSLLSETTTATCAINSSGLPDQSYPNRPDIPEN